MGGQHLMRWLRSRLAVAGTLGLLLVGCSGRQPIPSGPAPEYELSERSGAGASPPADPGSLSLAGQETETDLDESPEERKEQPDAAADAGPQ